MKLKAALDWEVIMKLPVAVCCAVTGNKFAATHLHYAMKTESVEICTD